MVHYKEIYALVPKAQKAIAGGPEERQTAAEQLPEYMREESYVPVGGSQEMGGPEGSVRVFNPSLPYSDINVIPFRFEMTPEGIPIPRWQPGEIRDQFLSAAHPALKTFGALYSEKGWDPFRKKELDAQAPAPRALRLLMKSPEVLTFLDNAARFAGMENGLDIGDDGKGHLLIDGKIQYLLENNFLLLTRLQQVADLPMAMFPELERLLAAKTGYKDRYEGTAKLLRSLSFWVGLSQRDVDLDKEEEYRFRDLLKKAEAERAKDRARTPGAQARRLAYQTRMRQREERLRR